jgi:hypothetical protein
MNSTLVTNQFTYRVELVACNLAIHVLNRKSILRRSFQRLANGVRGLHYPIWFAALTVTGIFGLISGFAAYCLTVLSR